MIKSIKVALRMVIIFGIFLNLHLFAQFADPESDHNKPHHNAHQNHIALFAGATTQLE